MPTVEELELIGMQVNEISIGQGDNGLQLCDEVCGYSSACCTKYHTCPGASSHHCNSATLWSSTIADTGAYDYTLYSGVWEGPAIPAFNYALSVRCISEL